METGASARLAGHLSTNRGLVCERVSDRLLHEFPELSRTLRLEETFSPQERLSQVSVERLSELVRAMLLFELPALADKELGWASGVLPRWGVTHQHQSTMIRWFFEELRRLNLGPGEATLTREMETYMLGVVKTLYTPTS